MARRRLTLPIEGLQCGECAAAVRRRLEAVDGVESVVVNYATHRATIDLDGGGAGATALVEAIRDAGYDCARASVTLEVEGLRRAVGAARIEEMIAGMSGVLSAKANQVNGTLTVGYLPGQVTRRGLETALEACGLHAAPLEASLSSAERRRAAHAREVRSLSWGVAVSVTLLVASLILWIPLVGDPAGHPGIVGRVLASVAGPLAPALPVFFELNPLALHAGLFALAVLTVVWPGRGIFAQAWDSVKHGIVGADVLVTLAAGSALVYSTAAAVLGWASPASQVYFVAAIAIVASTLLGRLVEARNRPRQADAVERLLARLPKKAHVERNGVEEDVPLPDLVPGDRIMVRPGEVVPVDGVVLSGESEIDESAVTGDALPVEKDRGSKVIGGSTNGRGTFAFEAEAVGKDTAIGQMARMFAEAQATKTQVQRPAERVAALMVPGVAAVASLTLAAWYAIAPPPSAEAAVVAFLTVLAIASPAALVLATPTAVMVGTDQAAQRGIVFRGADVLERLHGVDTVVFDKSGTVTAGAPVVTHVLGAKRVDGASVSPAEILRLAAAVESRSSHPVATAVVKSAETRKIEVGSVERFVEMRGRGVRGIVGRFLVEVVSMAHADERNLDLGDLTRRAEKHVLAGRMPVVVVVNDTVQGLIVLTDDVKPSAKRAMAHLRRLGFEIVMLTGDSRAAAGLFAKEVGIDRVIAEINPGMRADEIARLQWDGRKVAMVGDGARDAKALAAAAVGFAVNAGSDLGTRAADVTIVGDDLTAVPAAIEWSETAFGTARSSLRFGLLYHLIGIPLATGILYPVIGFQLGPVVAGALAAGAVIYVTHRSRKICQFEPTSV